MATRIDRAGIESCISKINAAIEKFDEAAREIDSSMEQIPTYWEGAAYDKARNTYEEQYKQLLTSTVPKAVGDFRDYIEQCKQRIIELDEQLAGN